VFQVELDLPEEDFRLELGVRGDEDSDVRVPEDFKDRPGDREDGGFPESPRSKLKSGVRRSRLKPEHVQVKGPGLVAQDMGAEKLDPAFLHGLPPYRFSAKAPVFPYVPSPSAASRESSHTGPVSRQTGRYSRRHTPVRAEFPQLRRIELTSPPAEAFIELP
jgi:hypothetical protein